MDKEKVRVTPFVSEYNNREVKLGLAEPDAFKVDTQGDSNQQALKFAQEWRLSLVYKPPSKQATVLLYKAVTDARVCAKPTGTFHDFCKVAPVCKVEGVNVIGASLDERVSVKCEVSADPSDVTFNWKFNNSGESSEVPPTRYMNNSTTSVLMYTSTTDHDYGTLSCWGRNAIGRQLEPCIFQVVPAGKPSALRNCSLYNQTGDSLEVECVPGFDGGLPQRFVLEVYEARTMRLRLNLTSDAAPAFRVAELQPGSSTLLRMVLYAANPKGRGELTVLDDIALWDAEKRTESVLSDGGDAMSMLPLVALMIGALVTALSVALLFALALRRRRATGGSPRAAALPEKLKPGVPSGEQQLDINHDHYVVSYTLKSMDAAAPDRMKRPEALFARGNAEGREGGGGTSRPQAPPVPPRHDASASNGSYARHSPPGSLNLYPQQRGGPVVVPVVANATSSCGSSSASSPPSQLLQRSGGGATPTPPTTSAAPTLLLAMSRRPNKQ
ncbi:hypothetical protein B566_EDAN011153 [Ephemera danica]|nr:hypothetical protein B566_EDAN011153 [Ephemera danica]